MSILNARRRGVTALSAVALVLAACQSDILSSRYVADSGGDSDLTPYYYLPKATVKIAISDAVNGNAKTFQLSVVSTRYIPDPKHLYRIDVDQSAFAHDDIDVQTTADGLLTSVRGKSKDQTGAIFGKLAELAKEVVKFTAFAEQEIFSDELDPSDPSDIARINNVLSRFKYEGDPRLSIKVRSPEPDLLARDGERCITGICYRAPIPYIIDLIQTRLEGINTLEEILDSAIAVVPNEARIGSIVVDRAAFVEKETTITFTSGMLTGLKMNKPSEALAAAQVPVDVAKTILSIPSDLLTFRTQRITDEQGLIEAQANFLKAQAELLKAQQELLKAGGGAATPGSPPAIPPPVQ